MKTLWQNADEEAQLNLDEYKNSDFYQNLRKIYCEGYCSGVWAVLEIISKDPAYKDAVELIKWKIGIKGD